MHNRKHGFSDKERRSRKRLIDLGMRQIDVSMATGIGPVDVNRVIKGISLAPAYIAEVYRCLGLEQPKEA